MGIELIEIYPDSKVDGLLSYLSGNKVIAEIFVKHCTANRKEFRPQYLTNEVRAAGHKHYMATCRDCQEQFKFYKWGATNLLHYPNNSISRGHKGKFGFLFSVGV